MALWICLDCSAAYSVGQSRCPNCRSTDYIEEGVMPKITVHGGASNEAAPTRSEWVGEHGPELINLRDGETVQPSPEEEPSPGSSSETSSTKPQSSDEPKTPSRRSRARTTENPS